MSTAGGIDWARLFSGASVEENVRSHWTRNLWRAFGRYVPRGACILEMGCGSGRLSALAAAIPGTRVIALDVSSEVLVRARATAAVVGSRPAFVQADGLRAPFPDGTFDVVLSDGVIEHFEDRIPQIVEEHARTCRSGGVVLVSTPNLLNLPLTVHKLRAGPTFHAYPEKSFTVWGLRRLLRSAGLEPYSATGFSPSASIEWYYLPTKRFRILDRLLTWHWVLAVVGYQVLVAARKP